MERRILALGRALRAEGAPVSSAELIDAAQAALAVGVEEREPLRLALRATLVKDHALYPDFERFFTRYFPSGPPRLPGQKPKGKGREPGEGATREGARSTPSGGWGRGEEPRTPRREGEEKRREDERRTAEKHGPGGRPEEQRQDRAARPSAAGEREEEKGSAERKRLLAKPFRDRWSAEEERLVLEAMEELARRVALRLARRRKPSRRGAFDLRRTLRANLQHGGVPFHLARRKRIRGRRSLVVLADVSGSVRRAARLFLLILDRLRNRFSGVRTFLYVDRPVELAPRRPGAETSGELPDELNPNAYSDHGEVLRRFNREFPRAAGGRTAVVILGDARNNRLPAQEWELEALRRRAWGVFWIVPEKETLWGTGDSAIAAYRPHCDKVYAAATPADLAGAALLLARELAKGY